MRSSISIRKNLTRSAMRSARFKAEDQASYSALMNGGCEEFATLFGAIEQAVNGR